MTVSEAMMASKIPNPIDEFMVDRSRIRYIGSGLQRPECILAERNGSIWTADARGGVVRIDEYGAQSVILQSVPRATSKTKDEATNLTEGTLPNGLAFARNGDIIVANFGTDRLEVMSRDGTTKVLVDQIDGGPIGKVNFVLRDSKDRLWLTISTRIGNWMKAISPHAADGYIALVDDRGIRVVADGFKFTNEIRLDANEEYLYIAETCGQCVSRMRVQPDGSLTDREVFGPSSLGGLPDGIAFDAYGNLWCTLVMTDRIVAIKPHGDVAVLLDDGDPTTSRPFLEAFAADRITPEIMLAAGGTIGPWFSSITFGGPQLDRVYLGNLRGSRIPYFVSPVPGLPMVHW